MIITNLLNGEQYKHEINTLHIYNENGVLFETNFEIEAKKLNGEKLEKDYNAGDIIAFELGEIRNARTLNFNKKDCFFKKRPVDYSFECSTDLYIHEDFIQVENLGEKISLQTEDETGYLRTYKLTFKKAELRKHNIEKIVLQEGENFKLPEGATWSSCYGTVDAPCFDIFDESQSRFNKKENPQSGVIKRWFSFETVDNFEIIATAPYYSKIVYSENELKARELAKSINDKKIFSNKEVSSYEIKRLLKYFDLKEVAANV